MATILEFRGGGGRVIHRPPAGGNCELILFPGVRYEAIAGGVDTARSGGTAEQAAKGSSKPH